MCARDGLHPQRITQCHSENVRLHSPRRCRVVVRQSRNRRLEVRCCAFCRALTQHVAVLLGTVGLVDTQELTLAESVQ